MLLIGPIVAVLAGAGRSALAADDLSQAALAMGVGLLLIGWLTNRRVPFVPLVGALGAALLLALSVFIVVTAIPPPGDDIGVWLAVWVGLPLLYGIGLLVSLIGFIGLIALGPLADR
jgi:hypothetical protein